MQPIVLTAIVDEKRRIMIDLPDDVPVGKVELVIRPLAINGDHEMTCEEMRARLIAAGLVTPNVQYAPDDAQELTPEDRERIGKALGAVGPMSELVIQDREDRV